MSRFFLLLVFTLLAFARANTLLDQLTPSTVPIYDENFFAARDQPASSYADDLLPAELIPPHLIAGTLAPLYDTSSSYNRSADANSSHHFHTTQSTNTFTFELMTQTAPWSPRIQPALLYQSKEIVYRRWDNGLQVSTGDNWLLLFEGSLSYVNLGNNTETANENDVWASMDGGQSWDLLGGVTRYGLTGYHTAYGTQANSFTPRGGSNNCEDPASDDIYSIAGYQFVGFGTATRSTSQVWRSTDAKRWTFQGNQFQPSRFFSSCDVDINGHVYSMGGLHQVEGTDTLQLLNDVWHTAQGGWTLATANAGWSPRAEHLTMIASDSPLNKEIIYVIGGIIAYQVTPTGIVQEQTNDVWASSDQGISWWRITANAPFFRRWGHGGLVTQAGVIVLFGGSNTDTTRYQDMYSYRDVWTSFDGGLSWNSCQLPSGDDTARQFIRTEQGVTVDAQRPYGHRVRLLVRRSAATGSATATCGALRSAWTNTELLASMCGGAQCHPSGRRRSAPLGHHPAAHHRQQLPHAPAHPPRPVESAHPARLPAHADRGHATRRWARA